MMIARAEAPNARATRFVSAGDRLEEGLVSATRPSASIEKPNSFGSCDDEDRQRDAVEVADPDRHGEQVGQQAETEQAERDPQGAGDEGETSGQGDGAVLIAGGERKDGGRDDRRQR